MKALKRLERMGQAIEELRPIISMLLKGEQGEPHSAIEETSKSFPDDSKIREAAKKVSETKAAKNADLLISEVNELLGKPMGDRKAKSQSHEDLSMTKLGVKDTEDSSDPDPRRDFWFSLAKQKIRI